jgi:hypothetical protein
MTLLTSKLECLIQLSLFSLVTYLKDVEYLNLAPILKTPGLSRKYYTKLN